MDFNKNGSVMTKNVLLLNLLLFSPAFVPSCYAAARATANTTTHVMSAHDQALKNLVLRGNPPATLIELRSLLTGKANPNLTWHPERYAPYENSVINSLIL